MALAKNSFSHKKTCKKCTQTKICDDCEANWRKGVPVWLSMFITSQGSRMSQRSGYRRY